MSARIPAKLVSLALAEVGVREVPLKSNKGPRVNEYKAATNLNPTEPWFWCAAFICWLVREAVYALEIPQTKTFRRPTTAGAWDFIRWSKEQDNTTSTKMRPSWHDIEAGDILVFDNVSHIGLCVKTPTSNTMQTVEGNAGDDEGRNGDGVYKKNTRKASNVRARIRFTV